MQYENHATQTGMPKKMVHMSIIIFRIEKTEIIFEKFKSLGWPLNHLGHPVTSTTVK